MLNSVVLVALELSEILPPLHDSHTKLVSCRNNLSQTVPDFVHMYLFIYFYFQITDPEASKFTTQTLIELFK